MASTTHKINWNTDPSPISNPLSALVPISDGHGGTIGLQLIATGPPRKPNQPVVIFESGFGGDAYEFATVMRIVAEMGIIRCFAYNRMGTQESGLRSDFKEDFEELMRAKENSPRSVNEEEANVRRKENQGYEEPQQEGSKENILGTGTPITAMDCVKDLTSLLATAEIPGPYITVAHSWGGVLMCQFLALKNPPIFLSDSDYLLSTKLSSSNDLHDRVLGMVFIDANQESSHDHRDIRKLLSILQSMTGAIDQRKLLNYESRCVREGGMTASEWAKCNDEESWPAEWNIKKQIIFGGIISGWEDSFSTLKSYQILNKVENGFEPPLTFYDPKTGRKKEGFVSAICGKLNQHETQATYDEAVKRGLGTDEEREWCRDLIESVGDKEREMQKGFLKLARIGNFIDAEKSGHSVHCSEPELVAREIKWVVEQLDKA